MELFRARRLVVDTGIHQHWTCQQAIDTASKRASNATSSIRARRTHGGRAETSSCATRRLKFSIA
jgi:hypothetical protein